MSIPYREILNNLDQGVCIVDDRQRIVVCNPWLCGKLNLSAEELTSTPLIDLITARAKDYFGARLQQVFDIGQRDILSQAFNKFLIEIPVSDSKIFTLMQQKVTIQPLHDGKKVSQVIIYISDVTADMERITKLNQYRKNLEKMVRKRTKELEISRDEALAAVKAKTRFLATMSHELRTPMNGVIGMVDVLADTELDDDQVEFLEIIRSSGNSLLNIINNILEYSNLESDRLTLESVEFDLSSCLESVISMHLAKAEEKSLRLHSVIEQNIPETVLGDYEKLKKILTYLVDNAIKFTTEGEIAVRVSAAPLSDSQVTVTLEVSDTGIGIPEKYQDHLFESFSQQNTSNTRQFGGTGLGLAIAAELTRAMGGGITVVSKEGEGSTFTATVLLGLSADTPFLKTEQAAPYARNQAAGNSDPGEILVVDDNSVNRKVLVAILKKKGYACREAVNGRKAVEEIGRNYYGLVFMDCHMPVMDGLQATAEIRKNEKNSARRRTPIIALTASEQSGIESCLQAGMDDYLAKPFNKEALFELLEKYLG